MFRTLNDRAFIVGGFCRDEILGLEPKDRDFVVEATVEEFETVFPDAKKVGVSFPVYLHPVTGEEIALTRTEKKGAIKTSNLVEVGAYQDFEVTGVGVTIQEDLRRRDFTINSIAKPYIQFVGGFTTYIDPYGGIDDLKAGVIRCVNPDAFSDDPLRIYRAARFAARFGFEIDPATADQMWRNRETLHLVEKERVVLELKKVYEQGDYPSKFFYVLADLGCLTYHFLPIEALRHVPAGPIEYHGNNTGFDHTMEALNRAKANGLNFDCFVSVLFHDTGKATTKPEILPHHYGHENRSAKINAEFFADNRYEASTASLAVIVGQHHMKSHYITQMKTNKLVEWFRSIRRLDEFIACCQCDHPFKGDEMDYVNLFKEVRSDIKVEVPKGTKDPHQFVTRLWATEFARRKSEKIS